MSLIDAREIESLSAQYGAPLRWTVQLDVSHTQTRVPFRQRTSEIVLVVPRPNECVLLHTKGFYPPGSFRLLTGGVETGERIADAARREIAEETGFAIDLTRFLGVVEYEFVERAERTGFVSYVWLTEPTAAVPVVTDVEEDISEFRQVAWRDLDQVADALERLPDDWGDWGRFRAIAHRLVVQTLRAGGLARNADLASGKQK